ncbi:glycosyl transferase family 2 [Bacillus sp. AFS018417]|uniref:glycosyltransferase family 2 protein n=1 Tax=Bacillus sp. AFS018417 TaxID=2033491 RepID=UPI000BF97220|nr:glycosyltransferase family 2 protein [Bacillus sp. AFS018417]PEZ03716.1 glycosyl transferase family 2 [Bacillus sp. AFS018417]
MENREFRPKLYKPTDEKNLNIPSRNKNERNKDYDIEVSIIIPSYNKYPLNLLTLYSLNNQTFDLSKMEVLFIDDASTDQTLQMVRKHHFSYHFKYIKCQRNLGRAKVRNVGMKYSRGKVLIFLDAEMIAEPEFVENHFNYHQSMDNLVLSGAMYYNAVYSCIFSEFSQEQIKEISTMAKNDRVLYDRIENYKHSNISAPYPLLERKDIDTKLYRELKVKTPSSHWYNTIQENFDAQLNGFHFPWMAFLTGNVSVRKKLIEQVGPFDKEFINYGYEDWELGYRLYKAGARYLVSNTVTAYHQEHPVGESRWKEATGNYHLFTLKHPDVDVLILGLELARITDLLMMNKVLGEYKLLVQNHPNDSLSFQKKFTEILETIALLLKIDIRHINILEAAGFDLEQKNELLSDINKIKKLRKYSNLVYVVEKIFGKNYNRVGFLK